MLLFSQTADRTLPPFLFLLSSASSPWIRTKATTQSILFNAAAHGEEGKALNHLSSPCHIHLLPTHRAAPRWSRLPLLRCCRTAFTLCCHGLLPLLAARQRRRSKSEFEVPLFSLALLFSPARSLLPETFRPLSFCPSSALPESSSTPDLLFPEACVTQEAPTLPSCPRRSRSGASAPPPRAACCYAAAPPPVGASIPSIGL